MGMSERSEGQMTALVEEIAKRTVGEQVWPTVSPFQKYKFKEGLLPLLAATIDVLDEEPHVAKPGDEIETWIKRTRDRFTPHDRHWNSLDWLLDDYRLHADTGTPLTEEVEERD